MSGTAAKLASAVWLRNLQGKIQTLFSAKYLLITNTTITIGLSGTGDILQQNYEMFKKRQSLWDPVRTRNICVTGSIIGPTCHFWYNLLDRLLPGRTLRVVGKKILIDQVIFSPVNISIFLVVLGYLEGASLKSVTTDLREKGLQLLKAEWIIWPPAQLVNFLFLPTKYRVLYDNTVSLGFDCYYSYVKFRKDKMSNEDTNKQIIVPSHHFGITCFQLHEKLAVQQNLRKSSKCSSEFDL